MPLTPDDSPEQSRLEQNRLQKYIQSRSMDDMKQLVTQINPDVKRLVAANVQALVGYLPSSEFNTSIMCNKENLQNLLASAMLTGYFVHAMEYRMKMDELFEKDVSSSPPVPPEPEVSEQTAEPSDLKSPEDLFAQDPKSNINEKLQDFQDKRQDFFSQIGEFISKPELFEQLKEHSENNDLNLHLEINTNFDLEDFLKEFRFLRSKQKTDNTEDEV